MEVPVDKVTGTQFRPSAHGPQPAADSLGALLFGCGGDVSVVDGIKASLLSLFIE